jgi:hypothetical protein
MGLSLSGGRCFSHHITAIVSILVFFEADRLFSHLFQCDNLLLIANSSLKILFILAAAPVDHLLILSISEYVLN